MTLNVDGKYTCFIVSVDVYIPPFEKIKFESKPFVPDNFLCTRWDNFNKKVSDKINELLESHMLSSELLDTNKIIIEV